MIKVKFRGKSDNKWVLGYYCVDEEEFVDGQHFEARYNIIQNGIIFTVDKKTVGQYIGLRDKNKIEIFEGDELEVYYSTPDGESHITKVVVEEIDNFGLMLDLENSDSLEIIGNIHDKIRQ